MINEEVLKGSWRQVSGKLKQHWGKLSDDDVRSFDGNVEQLVGRLQHKTGEAREVIERFLGQATDQVSTINAGLRDAAQVAGAKVTNAVDGTYDALRYGYEEAQAFVQERPAPSIAVAFGLGVASGLVATTDSSRPYSSSPVRDGKPPRNP